MNDIKKHRIVLAQFVAAGVGNSIDFHAHRKAHAEAIGVLRESAYVETEIPAKWINLVKDAAMMNPYGDRHNDSVKRRARELLDALPAKACGNCTDYYTACPMCVNAFTEWLKTKRSAK